MNTYKNDYEVILPNGKPLKLNSDNPPTDADIDFEFKRLYPEDFAAEEYKQVKNEVAAKNITDISEVQSKEVKAELKSTVDEGAMAYLFLEGLTLNLSDEAMNGAEAGWESLTTGRDFGEVYDEKKAIYKNRIETARQNNPALALSSEIGGAFASPLNFVGKIKGAGQLFGRAMGEGAIAGFGSSEDMDSALGDTFKGAAIATTTTATFQGLGFAFNKLTKNKLEDLTDPAGNTIPITLARPLDEEAPVSFAQQFYRDIVSPSLGSPIRQQEKTYMSPFKKDLEVKKQSYTKAKDGLDSVTNKAKQELTEAEAAASRALKATKQEAKVQGDELENALAAPYTILKDDVKSGAVLSRATKVIKDSVENAQANFRIMSFDVSMPSFMRTAEGEQALKLLHNAEDPNKAFEVIQKTWSSQGFNVIKGRSYDIDINKFSSNIAKKVKGNADSNVAFETQGSLSNTIKAYVDQIETAVVNGRVDGDLLSKIRSDLGSVSFNTATDSVSLGRSLVLKELKDEIESLIVPQLTTKQAAAFDADKKAWGAFKVLQHVVQKRSKGGEVGLFDAKDWGDSIASVNKYAAGIGGGALRGESLQVVRMSKAADDTVKKTVKKLADKIELRQKREVGKIKAKKAREIIKLEEDSALAKIQMRKDPSRLEDIAKNKEAADLAKLEMNKASEHLKNLNSLKSIQNPSIYHQKAAMQMTGVIGNIGGVLKGTARAAINIASALGTTQLASTKLAQKIAAKQTDVQKGMQLLPNALIPNTSTTVGEGMLRLSPILGRAMIEAEEQR